MSTNPAIRTSTKVKPFSEVVAKPLKPKPPRRGALRDPQRSPQNTDMIFILPAKD